MGFWEWMGFENPRDSPKTEQPKEGLPQVTDNVRDSGQTFVFGRSNAGEQVDIYHAYTDEVPGEQNKDIYFRRDEIFHVPGLGFNGLIGFSPIAMMKNSLGTSIAVDKYGSSFFKNGAQPSGVLEHPGVLKDPNRVRDNWEAAYGGAANAHRVAVLEEGMAYKADLFSDL